jgi:RsiW-degrading membrane proteinase PrsW (M82 family)
VAKTFLVFVAVISLFAIIQNPFWIIVLAIIFLPTALFIYKVKKSQRNEAEPADLNSIVNSYGIGFLPGALVVMLAELLLITVFALIFFGSQINDYLKALDPNEIQDKDNIIKKLDFSFGQVFLLILFMSYCVAALCEEGLKYFIAQRYRKRHIDSRSMKNIVIYSAAGALGFSTLENWGYTSQGGNDYGMLLFISIMRVIFATALHTMTGVMIGIGIAARDFAPEQQNQRYPAIVRVLLVPILVHGTWDVFAFSLGFIGKSWPNFFCAGKGSQACIGVADLVPLLINTLVLVFFYRYLKREYNKLPWISNPLSNIDDPESLDDVGLDHGLNSL